MSVGLPSDEVAEDYKNSLEDLTMNSRYEISNLTVIAKENTEHAMAISRVLENHIRNTPPDRKLPALYVLDSVVKNVGTPYTLFLGRNLYQTFMNAYSLVNTQVRKKLDEMLRTWKEPVPGSQDPRPVFPGETTRPIETALIKARTATAQLQQQQARSQQEMLGRGRPIATPTTQWRNTPTPPQINGRYPPPPQQGYVQQNGQNNYIQARPAYPQHIQQPPPQPTPSQFQPSQQFQHQHFQPPYQAPTAYPIHPPPMQNLDSLHRDIEDLISTAKIEFASSPYDLAIQQRLKALLDLQTILRSQQLPPDQIQLIRDQVAQLSLARPAPAAPLPPPTPSVYIPPPAPPVQQPADIQALLSSNKLADILANAAKAQQPPTPNILQIPLQQPQIPPSQSPMTPTPAPSGSGISLIASLRAAGVLPPDSNTPVNGSFVPPPAFGYSSHPPPASQTSLARPPFQELRNDVQLTAASLKISRPHLISTLYEARPNQCSTCGRRFLATEEGRTKKARHLDWHFRTNQRLADSAKRGQSRSWYVDELEWIKSRDAHDIDPFDTANDLPETSAAAIAATAAKNDPKNKYVPVPTDPVLANGPCPICQEKFNTSWNDEAQDFVWMDAIKIGSRVYHASCHAEIKKDGANTSLRTGTPDSVLGKRKAGVIELNSPRAKIKRDVTA